MIRCNNCGWYNNDTLTVCEKCGEPLPVNSGSPAASSHSAFSKTVRLGEEEASTPSKPKSYRATTRDISRTLKEEEIEQPQKPADPNLCPKCHYPLYPGAQMCPNCGTQIQAPAPTPAPTPAPEAAPEPVPAPAPSPAPATISSPSPSAKFKATVRDFNPVTNEQAPQAADQPKPANANVKLSGKATIRDVSAVLQGNESALQTGPRLIPLDGMSPIIYLSSDSIVVINGHQYRFVG